MSRDEEPRCRAGHRTTTWAVTQGTHPGALGAGLMLHRHYFEVLNFISELGLVSEVRGDNGARA